MLATMLEHAGIKQAGAYLPEEVQRLLGISADTFRRCRNLWEPENTDKKTIESFRAVKHRRVPHQALLDWLVRNHCGTMDGLG